MRPNRILSLALIGFLIPLPACSRKTQLPVKGSTAYNDAVSSFYVGLAALQVGHDIYDEEKLEALTRLVPGEPAGWANWGVLALRQRDYENAAQRLQKARDLSPNNAQIYYLLGPLESGRGNSGEAIANLRK